MSLTVAATKGLSVTMRFISKRPMARATIRIRRLHAYLPTMLNNIALYGAEAVKCSDIVDCVLCALIQNKANALKVSEQVHVLAIGDVSIPFRHWNVMCKLAETADALHHALLTVSQNKSKPSGARLFDKLEEQSVTRLKKLQRNGLLW